MWFSRDRDHMKSQEQRNFLLIISPSLMVLSASHLCAYAFYQKMYALHLHLVSGSQPPSLENSVTGETLGRIFPFLAVKYRGKGQHV